MCNMIHFPIFVVYCHSLYDVNRQEFTTCQFKVIGCLALVDTAFETSPFAAYNEKINDMQHFLKCLCKAVY